jgi:SAM-dependent methyltransferase
MKRCLACEALFEGAGWTCPKCGHQPALRNGIYQFAEEPPDAHAGFKPEYFARLAEIEESNFWFRARNELIQWALRNYFPDAKSFLEVGCGTGFVLAGIHEKFPRMRLAGSEIFADGLAIAKARVANAKLYQMDARRISFEREFDVVGAFDVLEHLPEDESALTQMFKAALPGGGLLVTVPQHPFLWSASDQYAMHQRRYNCTELRRKVESAGFQVQRITSFNSLLLPLMILSRMQGKRDPELNPWREFEISPTLNKALEGVLNLERMAIRAGISFPAGGSLLLIGRKPLRPS